MREHEKVKEEAQTTADPQQQDDTVPTAKIAVASRRVQREALHKAEQIKPTICEGLLIFQGMIRDDERAEMEVDHSFVHRLHESLVEKATDRLLDLGGEAVELGKHLTEHVSLVFGKVKSAVDNQTAKEDKLTALKATDIVVSEMYKAADVLQQESMEVIRSLPERELWKMYKSMRNAKMINTDDDDELSAGLANREMENLLGLKTGPAISHEVAKDAYHSYRLAVMQTKPVHEQIGDINEMKDGKFEEEKEEKARKSEKAIGNDKSIEEDTARRDRTEQFMMGGGL